MMLATDNSLDFVDWSNPVNWNHPLNRGLVEWFLAVPGTRGFGSNQWRGLCNRHVGTLTTATASASWKSSNRVGAMAEHNFDGASSDSVDFGSPIIPLTGDFTLSLWFRYDSSAAIQGVIGQYEGGGTNRMAIILNQNSAGVQEGNVLRFFEQTGLSIEISSLSVATWFHIALVRSSGVAIAYLNGKSQATSAWTTNVGNFNLIAGRLSPFTIYDLTGDLDDIRISKRALSSFEMRKYYEASRAGYPGLLNTIGTPGQSRILASFQPSWAIRSTTIAGVPAGA